MEKDKALMRLRERRLEEMQIQKTPEMVHELEVLATRAAKLKPFEKKGRTG